MFKNTALTKKSYRYLTVFVCLFLFNSPSFAKGKCVSGNCINGHGTVILPNGERYEGEFKNGKFQRGVVNFPNGSKYEGDVSENGKMTNGYFFEVGKDGHVSEWKAENGKLSMSLSPTGDDPSEQSSFSLNATSDAVNSHAIKNNCTVGDCINGQGTEIYSSGDKYVGEFKDGKRSGQGMYIYANGTRDIGEFKNGEMNGQGTKIWANGNKYVGEFKDDKPDGEGTFTKANGTVLSGSWYKGEPMLVKKQEE